MAKIFLDTNYFIDFAERDKTDLLEKLEGNKLYISVFSVLVLAYVYKYKIPNNKIKVLIKKISLSPLNKTVLELAFDGPTDDLEDNIQLLSAAKNDCDIFLTNDKNILKMKFFGKVKIVSEL